MKFALLIYEDESLYGPDKDGPALMEIVGLHMKFNADLGDVRLGGAGLGPAAKATTVKTLKGQKLVHDGPFAETREQLAGFYIVEATDLAAAIEIAKKVPVLQEGSIEIRPLLGPG